MKTWALALMSPRAPPSSSAGRWIRLKRLRSKWTRTCLQSARTGRRAAPRRKRSIRYWALEYDVAQAFYKDLLAKKNAAALAESMEVQQLGEQMHIVVAAGLPEAPFFPERPLFALWGLCAGLLLGLGRILWPAARKLFQRLASLFPTGTESE